MLIKTTFLKETSTLGLRISAQSVEGGPRVVIPYPHDLPGVEKYRAAAVAYLNETVGMVAGDLRAVGTWSGGYYFLALGLRISAQSFDQT